jgi:PAS domain S-box-containing protein
MSENQYQQTKSNDILIVDDKRANLKLLSELLGREGYQVRPSNNPQLAIDSALGQPPALILLDVRMPEIDGFEVCKRLKQDERTREIPVIFISALQDVEDKVRGFEAGGVDFITKPFQEEEVLARVRTHMELRNVQLHLEDIVDERTAELAKSEAKYRGLVDNSIVGVFTTTFDGRFKFANDAMARMYDFESPEHMIAKGSMERWSDLKDRERMLAELQKHGSVTNFEAETITDADRHIHVLFSVNLLGEDLYGVVMDITYRKNMELMLEKSSNHLKRAQEIANSGSWEVNLKRGKLFWSDEVYRIFGLPQGSPLSYEEFLKTVLPEDRGYVDRSWQAALRGEPYDIEHRIQVNGEVKWLREKAEVEIDGTGRAVRGIGTVQDITERKQAEQKISEYQKRLKALASQLTIAEEKERRAIAADLHDHVGQSLALARMQIASARKSTLDSKLADDLDDISATLLKSLEDTQQLMLELSSHSMHDTGLSSAISDWLEGEIGKKHSLETEVIGNVPENRKKTLDSNVRTVLFRNVRELVVNVVKHARANKVSVRLEARDASIRVIVEDDGIGFDPRAVTQPGSNIGGFGLFSIQELMADLGGDLKIVSEPGKGCTAILSAPFGDEEIT